MNITKRIACVLIALLMLTALVSCNGDNDTENGHDADSPKNDGVSYYVEYRNVKIKMGAEADSIIEALGEYQDRREIGDCGGLGAQVKYSYPSLDVYVLESKDGGSVIDEISFRDDTVTTPEGVYIGMTADKAKSKSGEPTAETDKKLEYEGTKYVLVITLKDGAVSKIDYLNK